LGIGEGGGLYAVEDDGNPIWEDVEWDPEDPWVEIICRNDDQSNGFVMPGKGDEEMKAEGTALLKASKQVKP
jgi:hypothetical protein